MSTPVYTQDQVNRDLGTDAPTKTLQETQQPPQTTGPIPYQPPPLGVQVFDDGSTIQTFDDGSTLATGTDGKTSATNATDAVPATTRGVGSSNDDQAKPSAAATGQVISAAANGPTVAQPNVLDQYASYTYSLSWYILTPAQFNELASGEVNMNKWMLLMQSGGAQANVNDNGTGGRSPYFTLDYYMDNLILETNLPGGGTGGTLNANNGGKLEFTVTEPNGLTLPNNLALAYQDALKNATGKGEKENWAQALFCMVIRFYGYDDDGNLVQAGRNGNQNGTSSIASPRANVQKIYPFAIEHFDFRLAGRVVEYKIQATCPIFTLNASTRRGSVPTQFELVGKSVGDILEGNGSTGTQVVKDDGRQTVTAGVAQAQKQAPAPVPTTLASQVTGQDNPLATSGGMDFSGQSGLSG